MTDHGHGIAVPCNNENSKVNLIEPKLPDIVEANFLRVDAGNTPSIKKYGCNRDRIEHSFGANAPSALDSPHSIHADSLRQKADHEEVCQGYAVIGHYLVLQGQNDGNGSI